MVCAVTISTLAGVSMTVSPNRLALCATALSGVTGIPASALGFDPATLPGIGGARTGLGAEGASAPRYGFLTFPGCFGRSPETRIGGRLVWPCPACDCLG